MTNNKALQAVVAASTIASLISATQVDQPPCPSYRPYEYLGCYMDDRSDRSLPFEAGLSFSNMTVEACTAACKGNNFHYAGVEYYGECYCGAGLSADTVAESDCNFPCNGNSKETCGGDTRLSIWVDPTYGDSVADEDDFQPMGCYTEGNGGRALAIPRTDLDANSMTTELCLNACGQDGFPYAGTEWSQECYCGVQIDRTPTIASASDCNYPCKGNTSEMCGGNGRLNLYKAPSLLSNEPCGSYNPPQGGSSSSPAQPSSSSTSKPPGGSSSPPPPTTPSTPSSSSTWKTSTTPFIPSNSYTPPPYTPSKTSNPPPAPTSSCICATPAPWAGNKCVGKVALPCVGCNDVQNQRSQWPFKLFNNKNLSQCPKYQHSQPKNACQDACKTQYQWCLNYSDHCRKNGHRPENADKAKQKCIQQYSDCWKVQSNIRDSGLCSVGQNKNRYTSDNWFGWVSGWLNAWGWGS